MKQVLLNVGVVLLVFLAGCRESDEQIEVDMKEAALTSIAAKHPDVDTSELAPGKISRGTLPNGEELISVVFAVPSSEQSIITNTPEGRRRIVTTKSFNVMMSPDGKARSVHEGTIEDIYSIAE